MNWLQAKELLSDGLMMKRANSPWSKKFFVFKQVPSIIGKEIVPKMQSLPQSVKNEFQRRFEDEPWFFKAIYYCDQYALVGVDNRIYGWVPNEEDMAANDWEVYIP